MASLILLLSCQREIEGWPDVVPPDTQSDTVLRPISPPPDNKVTASIQGRVLDENSYPLENAVVIAGDQTAFTDEYGIFRITDATVSEYSTFVKVNKPGYFTGSRTVVSRTGGNGYLQIKMIPKKQAGSFKASGGATVHLDPTAHVQFQPNSVVNMSGQPYSGNVRVFGAVIDPTAEDFTAIMPGDLRGIRSDSQLTAMKSYGMLTVVLEGESGEQLQLAEEKTAVISMKVPSALLADAPAEMPLWHFSETDGKWREDGKATLRNGEYSGSVSHFSTWNYDVPIPREFISLTARGFKGWPVPYTRIRFSAKEGGVFSEGYTDSTGYLRAWAPKGSPLVVQVLNDCGGVVFAKEIAPLTGDTDLGDFYVSFDEILTVSGTVKDCVGQPVKTGNANLFHAGLFYTTPIANGEFYISLTKCDPRQMESFLYISDPAHHYVSDAKYLQIVDQDVDAGEISNCNLQLIEYTFIQIGSDTVTLSTRPPDYEKNLGDTAARISFRERSEERR